MMDDTLKRKAILRLHRIQGQVRGIEQMVADERYCIDVITQIAAAESALHKLRELILRNHIETCVLEAFRSGDSNERKKKVEELMEAYVHCRAR
jgi:CsoR family transcriptional regulator, copper-sensing transcriptional repressor